MIPGGDTALNMKPGSRGAFARALLQGLGAPETEGNMRALMAWMTGENTRAANNPLATTIEGYEGATTFNSARVKNFKDFDQGVEATLRTLNLSYYTDIVDALRRGTNVQELYPLVRQSPWGTQHFGTGDFANLNVNLGTQASDPVNRNNLSFISTGDTTGNTTGETGDGLVAVDPGTGVGVYETQQEMDDAWDVARQMLADYGLEALFDDVYELVTTGRSTEMAMQLIRTSDEYKARFKGMDERVANGYNAITPERYLELENNYKSMMNQAGFDPEFIGEDFSEFIANDVNETEFGDRINVALSAVEAADPLVLDELKDRYGIGVDSKADLVMYFLDPERAINILEAREQVGVAKLAAATTGVIGGRLGTATAEKLYQRGYGERELAERLKGKKAFRQQLVGEQKRTKTGGPLSSTELAAAEFGLDSEAVAMVKNLTRQRQQRGSAVSGAAITSSGVTGFGRGT